MLPGTTSPSVVDQRSRKDCGADSPSQSEIDYAQGIEDERDRVRREFIAWIKSQTILATVQRDYFLAELDRICPKE